MHILCPHADQQLGHANIGEPCDLEHLGQHPGLPKERVMRRRPWPAYCKALEPLEEHLLSGRGQAPAAAADGDATAGRKHTTNLRQRPPGVLEAGERLPEHRNVEHIVVKYQVVCVHDRVSRVPLTRGALTGDGDHVR